MKASAIAMTLMLAPLTNACTEDHKENEDRASRWQEPTMPISNTHTPSTSISIQPGTFPPMGDRENTSLAQPPPASKCKPLDLPGSDANKIDDECGLTGVEVLNPVTTVRSGTTPRNP